MRIVILSGTMYPHISARSFRTTELAKGFAKMGHDVSLYTILGNYDYTQMEKDCPNLHIKTMGRSHFGNPDSDGKLKKTILQKALTRLFYNVIDYPRCEFFFKAIKVLEEIECFDYLITIAHPYGVHWGAAYYKKKHFDKLKFKFWASDCGDPFMGNPHTKRWRLFQEPIEKFWGRMTDRIVIPVDKGREAYYPEVRNKICVIPQSVDFDSFELDVYHKNSVTTFFYSGAVYPKMRDPRKFLEYLSVVDFDFKFIVYVPSESIFGDYKEKLGEKLEIHSYIPRVDLVKVMSSMDFLVNFSNNSGVQTPSKLIDYSISKRPILNISTEFSNSERLNFEAFIREDYSSQFIVQNIEQYDSKNVCAKFIELYDEGVGQ